MEERTMKKEEYIVPISEEIEIGCISLCETSTDTPPDYDDWLN